MYLEDVNKLRAHHAGLTHRRAEEERVAKALLKQRLDEKYKAEEHATMLKLRQTELKRATELLRRLEWYPKQPFFAVIGDKWHRCIINRPTSKKDWAAAKQTLHEFKRAVERIEKDPTRPFYGQPPRVNVAIDERHPYTEYSGKYRKVKDGFQRRSHRVNNWTADLTRCVTRTEFRDLLAQPPGRPTRLMVSPTGSKAWVLDSETHAWRESWGNPSKWCRAEGPAITSIFGKFGSTYGPGFTKHRKPEAFVAGFPVEDGLLDSDGNVVAI